MQVRKCPCRIISIFLHLAFLVAIMSLFAITSCILLLFHPTVASIDYGAALTKSLLYFEAQRSGKLPANQRVQWRGDSALNDGNDAGIDLVGGYYDAGDNVKFGLPMAFTVTMLAWGVVEFREELRGKNELSNALEAIRWGTEYLMKAHPEPNVVYGQVGDGESDHKCWQRPEDMTTPRDAYKIDQGNPGADLSGEMAAAFAASALAFYPTDPSYHTLLITHAKQLFDFATKFPGLYTDSIPKAKSFYSSSGYEDERLWAAAWLQRATQEQAYLDYIQQSQQSGGTRAMFSWDDKFLGAQLLVAQDLLEGEFSDTGNLGQYKDYVEQFICNCIQKGSDNVKKTSGGLLWFAKWNNLQYTTSATIIITTYAKILTKTESTFKCPASGGDPVGPGQLISFVKSQVDNILGENLKSLSYMVGFGPNYPQKVHHRGASIVSIKNDGAAVTCEGGYAEWFKKEASNPNVLEGAIVGGPDLSDSFMDSRDNYSQNEPATANTAPLVGVLARLAQMM